MFSSLSSLTGGGGLSASSSASATGGTIGAFNFSPKGNSLLPLAIGAGVVLVIVLLLRK